MVNNRVRLFFLSSFILCAPVLQAISAATLKDIIKDYTLGLASMSSLVSNRYQFNTLGFADVSPETKQIIDGVLAEMALEKTVYVKQMSTFLKERIGNQNAFATANTLFIDEEWFNSLSSQEQRALIGHEAVHIKNKDVLRGPLATFASSLVAVTGINICSKRISNKYACLGTQSGLFGLAFLTVKAFQRYQEKQADCQSIKQLHCHKGAIALNKRLLGGAVQPEPDSYLSKFTTWVAQQLSSHPSLQERISYASHAA